MSAELLIQAGIGETRIARVADGRLEDFVLERGFQGRAGLAGDIIYGRVQKVVAGIGAAFVEIGQARPGFLALSDAMILSRDGGHDISACVREGEAVLVQAILEPMGEKGARLSAALSLPGRLLVMTPNKRGISLSHRIDGAAREKLLGLSEALQAAHPDAGFILRTEAADASEDDILAEAQHLAQSWRDIDQARRTARPPTTLYRELGPIERSLREMARADISHIRIDDAATLDAARKFCRRALPPVESKLVFASPPLFDEALEEQIATLFQPRVTLASGGWITIEATEGLTAIDVNSGSFTQSSGLAQTSLTTNLEAAREIGPQLRLRGIGGLIVIDFIQSRRPEDDRAILAALSQSAGKDGVPCRISPMADFGIVAIARKRVRESLDRLVSEPCDCTGGRRLSAETQALEMLRRLEREARANPGRGLRLRASPRVLTWLANHDEDVRAGLARRGVARVRFEEGKEAIDAL